MQHNIKIYISAQRLVLKRRAYVCYVIPSLHSNKCETVVSYSEKNKRSSCHNMAQEM